MVHFLFSRTHKRTFQRNPLWVVEGPRLLTCTHKNEPPSGRKQENVPAQQLDEEDSTAVYCATRPAGEASQGRKLERIWATATMERRSQQVQRPMPVRRSRASRYRYLFDYKIS
ncbi:hypothetical protein TGARI_356950 [Toxoplasma gondii ARI]|uniref:Uncharacterized protein n=1 Tax=Toxoplasma gondii ARI TaxID=1074872 RepID=A0A139XSW7_TOXGO|nr:hypothetical protein TGARI_356950 [Toxoplasma gondii ARI]